LEHEAQIKELRSAKEKDEISQKKIKIRSHASSSQDHDSLGEESLRINKYYQPPLRRTRRDRREQESPREVRVDLPDFHGKENVEVYLDWEMKVEQLFACHRVSEERKVPLATLSFQEDVRSLWTQRETNVRIGKKPEILNWDELKMCMRRKFVPLPYVKKSKLREEMKELMEKRRNFINREKEYIRREKEFKEKFQALVRRKAREEKEKREKVMIEKGHYKNLFFEVESDIDNILSSLKNPCEDVLVEKSKFGAEPDIDINVSSIENTEECLTKKEEEETNKEEESCMTPLEIIAEKESLGNIQYKVNKNIF